MGIYPVLRDDNGQALSDRGSELGTKRYTGIGTGGTAIELPCDCKEVLVVCDQGGSAWKITGTITGAAEACTIPSESMLIPVCAESGDEPFTISAVTGTVDVSLFILR